MTAFLQTLIPSLSQLAGFGAVLIVAAAFISLGGLLAGRRRRAEADIIYGWGLVVAIFTLAGASGLSDFTSLAALLAAVSALAAAVCWWRDGRLGPAGAARMLVLALPLLLLVAAMIPTQWDELTNWLPNARYLIEHDSFPRSGMPDSPSVVPAYPYGLPLVIFLASRLTGFMVENAAAIFNLLLLLSFGLLVARLVVAAATDAGSVRSAMGRVYAGWSFCALAGLLVTALNPTYVSRLVFSTYADAPTAIAVGFASALTWLMLNALADGDNGAARSYAWQAGLAATAAVGLKQVNLVFLIALAAAAMLIALRDPAIRGRALVKVAPCALVLPVLVYLAWRMYVAAHISGGEFSFRPLSEWFIALIPDIAARMALVASKKGGYFGIMVVAVVLALRAVWRPRTEFDRLAVLTATMFLAYNGFLLLCYVAAFEQGEALRAASYWRYNTHLGGVCLVFAGVGLAMLWRRRARWPVPRLAGAAAVVLVLAMPLAMAKKLRFDLHPRYGYAHSTGSDIAHLLSPDDRLLLVDPADDGQYLVIMRYRLHGSAAIVGEITAWHHPTAETIRRHAERLRPTHVWAYAARPEIKAALGVRLEAGASYLLARGEEGWTVMRRWPHPGTAERRRGAGM